MIIYATSPNRFLPYFSVEIRKAQKDINVVAGKTVIFIEKISDDEWYAVPTVPENKECEYYSHFQEAYPYKRLMPLINGKHRMIFDEEFRKKFKIVTGVMDCEKILKEKDDFIFCSTIHPVDHVYEMYYFMQYIAGGVSLDIEMSKENIGLWSKLLNFAQPTADFSVKSKDNIVSLESYVDTYLETKGIFKLPGTNMELCENIFQKTHEYGGNTDFISFVTDAKSILRTCSVLNSKIGTNLQFHKLYYFVNRIRSLVDSNLYRKKDLERLLEEKIYHYEMLKKHYMS